MPRMLLIDPDRGALFAMQTALRQAGFSDVTAVTSGSFALTMLERHRPDLIVSRLAVPDINGYELCAIVRKDPSMTGVLFLLLASPGDEMPEVMLEDKPDQTLAGDLPVTAIVSEVAQLLRRVAPAAVATRAPTAPAAQPEGAHGLRGSLAVMELPDITQAMALGAKTGQLAVTLPSGCGAIFFDRGRVVHAEFRELVGEPAFAALVVAAHGKANGTFVFNPLVTAAGGVRTIQRDLKKLLLDAATGIDEGRADAGSAPLS